MRFAVSPRELRKLLKRMGVSVEAEEVKATRVVIEREDGTRLVLTPIQVMAMKIQGQYMFSILASEVEEEKVEEEKPRFTEEDVKLVAEQAGVSLEEARKALEETGGDIAAAIMKLLEKKGG